MASAVAHEVSLLWNAVVAAGLALGAYFVFA